MGAGATQGGAAAKPTLDDMKKAFDALREEYNAAKKHLEEIKEAREDMEKELKVLEQLQAEEQNNLDDMRTRGKALKNEIEAQEAAAKAAKEGKSKLLIGPQIFKKILGGE